MYEVYLDKDDIAYMLNLLWEEGDGSKQVERIVHALEMASIPVSHNETECKQRSSAD
jgi:hypothetical protein